MRSYCPPPIQGALRLLALPSRAERHRVSGVRMYYRRKRLPRQSGKLAQNDRAGPGTGQLESPRRTADARRRSRNGNESRRFAPNSQYRDFRGVIERSWIGNCGPHACVLEAGEV